MIMTQMVEGNSDRVELDRLLAGIAAGVGPALPQDPGCCVCSRCFLLKDPEEAGDVTQDAFVRIWDNAQGTAPRDLLWHGS